MGLSNWYAIYTKSRAEKKAAIELERAGLEVYLPLSRSLRQWSDRKKWADIPLIPSYLFIKSENPSPSILSLSPHALAYVRHNGRAAQLRDGDIQEIKNFLSNYRDVQLDHRNLDKGSLVQVERGPFKGQRAEVLFLKGNYARLRIDVLDIDLIAEIATTHLERV